jgi:hypothetical protein
MVSRRIDLIFPSRAVITMRGAALNASDDNLK